MPVAYSTLTVARWRQQPEPPIYKVPTIFALYAAR